MKQYKKPTTKDLLKFEILKQVYKRNIFKRVYYTWKFNQVNKEIEEGYYYERWKWNCKRLLKRTR